MPTNARKFFSKEQQGAILLAIKNAELDSGGEIRVHLETNCPGNALDRAAYLFKKLKMHKTKLRNSVLFYLAVENRKFATIGDVGINAVVPDQFWEEIKMHLLMRFRESKFTEGLCEAIEMTGQQLKKLFPYQKDDVNELPDELSFGPE
ncbi:MAG: TPM domain-containing protein [Bacteroidales bacterium]|nr:TPM domain-containing protein [Bacteroidales bacterium]MDZ4204942.1 TPM domain-containing protein [Bacteroidales bacterium]